MVTSTSTVARVRDVSRARVARRGDGARRRREDDCRGRRVGARARVVAPARERDGEEGERRYVRQGHANEDVERERVRARARKRERRGEATRRRAKRLTTRRDAMQGNCYGCGVSLQTKDDTIAGYVDPKEYATKATHKQFNMMICARCAQLSNGKFVNAVEGQGGLKAAPGLITPKQLRDQLKTIRERKALVVKVVDVTDFHGSFLKKVRDVVGGNPILLVVTKVDLLNANTDYDALRDWIAQEAEFRRLTLAGIALVSSRRGFGMRDAVLQMMRERKGRDVYVLGAANVGKSTFIRAAMDELRSAGNYFAPSKRLPVASAMPGTTLGVIPLRAFEGKGVLFDTPGLFLHHRLNSLLGPEDLSTLRLGTTLKKYVPETPKCAEPPGFASFQGYSLCWGSFVRLEVVQCPPNVGFSFYGPKSLRLEIVKTSEVPPTTPGQEEAALRVVNEVDFIPPIDFVGPLVDLSVSGLGGWIRVEKTTGRGDGPVRVRVHGVRGLEVFDRDVMPKP